MQTSLPPASAFAPAAAAVTMALLLAAGSVAAEPPLPQTGAVPGDAGSGNDPAAEQLPCPASPPRTPCSSTCCDWIFFEEVESSLNFRTQLFEDCDHPMSCIMVGVSYALLLAAFVWIAIQGYRTKRPGMPLVGQCGLLVVGIIVLAHMSPIDQWLGPFGTERFFPGDLEDDAGVVWSWRIHVLALLIVFVQYLLHGRNEVRTPLLRRLFFPLVVGVLVATTITLWLFVIYYEDFYVNEIYPLSTLVMAAGFYGTLISRSAAAKELAAHPELASERSPDLRGLSVLGAWGLALGTALLYLGTIFGGLEEAYTDHEETGHCLIYWIYGLSILLLIAYAWLLTHRRRHNPPGPGRPCL